MAFAAAVVGILWTEANKRREEERKHYRDVNMFRRVSAADLNNARAQIEATSVSIRGAKFDPLVFRLPTVREYPLEKVGMLTVDEISAVAKAAHMVEHLRSAIAVVASKRDSGDWFTMSLEHVKVMLPELEMVIGYLDRAIAELKAETGPVP